MFGGLIKRDYILVGDARKKILELEALSVDTIITSPPYYGLRDYGIKGQIGLEDSPGKYIEVMVDFFRDCRDVLKDHGTLWLNLGDGYWSGKNRNGYDWQHNSGKSKNYMLRPGGDNDLKLKPKDLIGMPWRIALALQEDGWYLRSDIIWSKTNCTPEPVKDRPTKSHEYLFMFSKSRYYYYDYKAVEEEIKSDFEVKKRNRRSVWSLATSCERDSNTAVFPEKLIEPCILAGSKEGDTILDPFMGTGTTAKKALELNRHFIGFEIDERNIERIDKKLSCVQMKMVL